jgi:hypothetical protein
MVKEAKYFRKQAEKAERLSRALSDSEGAEDLYALSQAYRSQADMLKKSEKARKPKKKPSSKRR